MKLRKLRKLILLAFTLPANLLFADMYEDPSLSGGSTTHEKTRDEKGLPQVGDVFVCRAGEWKFGFSEYIRLSEIDYYRVVADKFDYMSTLGSSKVKIETDVIVCSFNPETQSLYKVHEISPEDVPEESKDPFFWMKVPDEMFEQRTHPKKEDHMVFLVRTDRKM